MSTKKNIITFSGYVYDILEDGYVIVRTLNYDAYRYDHPLVSMQTYYDQLVITGYDFNGNPLWQLAGNVRTG